MADTLTKGRDAYERHEWSDAYAMLTEAEKDGRLGPDDMARLARAAHLIGDDERCDDLLSRAHSAYLEEGDLEQAAECAFWLAFRLLQAGERARGGGWLARTQRLVDESELEGAITGFLLLPQALGALSQGATAQADEHFAAAYEIGRRYRNAELTTLARLGRGQALVRMGKIPEGISLLDEVMVDITTGDVSPLIIGIVYCAVIAACHEVFDLRRAQEWTEAFTRWCAAEPEVEPFRGECMIRRAEIMQVHGRWSDAMDVARRAGDHLSRPPGQRAAGAAFYRQAEIRRLRGEFVEAEKAFREAQRWGRTPQPGLALLRLNQGRTNSALADIRRAVEEAADQRTRSNLLPAFVEILVAAGEMDEAGRMADELNGIADTIGAPYLGALAHFATGIVVRASGRNEEALTALRSALTTFREVGAPYEAARTLVEIGLACRALGDEASCAMEFDEARSEFERLNAAPDLARLDELTDTRSAPGGLTPRELEVLTLVATGKTNREIAEELFISEKTVARHISNIFNKLGLSSRAAATAYAYEAGLM